jgi:lauroyl/myristoyl acyltransferase
MFELAQGWYIQELRLAMRRECKFLTAHDLYLVCVIALIKVVDRSASLGMARFFARSAALAAWLFSKHRRRARSRRLAQTLGVSEDQVRPIVKKCFYEFWCGIFSLPYYGSRRSMRHPVEIRGLENLQEALAKGKGVIVWESNSFGKRILAKRILHGNGVFLCQVHGQDHLEGFRNSKSWTARNVIQPFFESYERPFVQEIMYLTTSDLSCSRTLLERLRRNAAICIAADGKQGHKLIPVQFLGSAVSFSTGMASLARLSGATILPMFCIQENGENANVIIERPISIEPNEDRERCLEKSIRHYAALLESYIVKYPEQYFNWRL